MLKLSKRWNMACKQKIIFSRKRRLSGKKEEPTSVCLFADSHSYIEQWTPTQQNRGQSSKLKKKLKNINSIIYIHYNILIIIKMRQSYMCTLYNTCVPIKK